MGRDTKIDPIKIGRDVTYGLIWLRIRSSGDLSCPRRLLSSSNKVSNFFDLLSDC
jgi:hypothetical protein